MAHISERLSCHSFTLFACTHPGVGIGVTRCSQCWPSSVLCRKRWGVGTCGPQLLLRCSLLCAPFFLMLGVLVVCCLFHEVSASEQACLVVYCWYGNLRDGCPAQSGGSNPPLAYSCLAGCVAVALHSKALRLVSYAVQNVA